MYRVSERTQVYIGSMTSIAPRQEHIQRKQSHSPRKYINPPPSTLLQGERDTVIYSLRRGQLYGYYMGKPPYVRGWPKPSP